MRETDAEILTQALRLHLLLFGSKLRLAVAAIVLGALAREVELGDADRQLQLCQLVERLLQRHRVERVAVQVALDTDTRDRRAHVEQTADVLHVVIQPVAGQDVVVIDEQLRVRIAVLDP